MCYFGFKVCLTWRLKIFVSLELGMSAFRCADQNYLLWYMNWGLFDFMSVCILGCMITSVSQPPCLPCLQWDRVCPNDPVLLPIPPSTDAVETEPIPKAPEPTPRVPPQPNVSSMDVIQITLDNIRRGICRYLIFWTNVRPWALDNSALQVSEAYYSFALYGSPVVIGARAAKLLPEKMFFCLHSQSHWSHMDALKSDQALLVPTGVFICCASSGPSAASRTDPALLDAAAWRS